MNHRTVNIFVHKGLATLMTVWFSGLVFLVSCQFAQGAPSIEEHFPLAAAKKAEHHCDKGDSKESPAVSFPTNAVFDCCSFLPRLFDRECKVEYGERTAAPALSATVKFVDRPDSGFAVIPRACYSTPVTYRNKIFIRNRILRI
jgi:hypothetical protein